MENVKFCQSCGMPLEGSSFGTNADGTPNEDYCKYCLVNGKFGNDDETMEEMIESCIPYVLEAGAYKTAEEARASMLAFFPTLKRWKKS